MCERAAQRSRSICRDCGKVGNNHGTFTTKVVESVFVLATRGHDILYGGDLGEKILCRSVCHVELSCAGTGTTVHKSTHVIFVP